MNSLTPIRMSRRLLAFFVTFGVAVATVTGAAGSRELDIDISSSDWSVFTPPGKQPAAFARPSDGSLRVVAANGVSFMYKELPDRMRLGTKLRWRWRVDQAPAPTDLMHLGKDDRPLAVHVWYPKSPAQESFWDGIKEAFGYPVLGDAVTYVWGGANQRGDVVANPHLENARADCAAQRRNRDRDLVRGRGGPGGRFRPGVRPPPRIPAPLYRHLLGYRRSGWNGGRYDRRPPVRSLDW